MRLKGKKAIVTGAGGGIGQAICIAFAKEGAELICADISEPAVVATVSRVEANGGKAIAVIGNMADESHSISLVEAAEDKLLSSPALSRTCPTSLLQNYPSRNGKIRLTSISRVYFCF